MSFGRLKSSAPSITGFTLCLDWGAAVTWTAVLHLVAGAARCLYKELKTEAWPRHERWPRVRGLAASGRGRNADAHATQPARRLRRMALRRGRRHGAGLAAAAGAHDRPIRTRRRRRHHRPHRRAVAAGEARPAGGDREPAGRRR